MKLLIIGLIAFCWAGNANSVPVGPASSDSTKTPGQVKADTSTFSVGDSLLAIHHQSDMAALPTTTPPDTAQPGDDVDAGSGDNQPGWLGHLWQTIDSKIDSINKWWIVAAAFLSWMAAPFRRWRKKQHRLIPTDMEKLAFNSLVEIPRIASTKDAFELRDHMNSCNDPWKHCLGIFKEVHSREWGQIRQKAKHLSNPAFIMSEQEINQEWKF